MIHGYRVLWSFMDRPKVEDFFGYGEAVARATQIDELGGHGVRLQRRKVFSGEWVDVRRSVWAV